MGQLSLGEGPLFIPTAQRKKGPQSRVQRLDRRYLLGAFCGLFRQVVVGVVSLCDPTEQHSHNACQTHTHTHSESNTVTLTDRLHCVEQVV